MCNTSCQECSDSRTSQHCVGMDPVSPHGGRPSRPPVPCCHRYPKAWAERAEDAKAKEKRLRGLLQAQRARARQTFSARVPF